MQEVSVQILGRTPNIIADVILPIICLTKLSVQGEMKFAHKIAILGLLVNIRGVVIQHVLRLFLLAIHVTVKWRNAVLSSVILQYKARCTQDTHCRAGLSCDQTIAEYTHRARNSRPGIDGRGLTLWMLSWSTSPRRCVSTSAAASP